MNENSNTNTKKFMEDKEGSPEWEYYNSWCPDLT